MAEAHVEDVGYISPTAATAALTPRGARAVHADAEAVEASRASEFVPPGFVATPQGELAEDEEAPAWPAATGSKPQPSAPVIAVEPAVGAEPPPEGGDAAAAAAAGGARLVLGRYEMAEGRPLGEGGWCIVHRAWDTSSPSGQARRGVAIKTYHAQAVRDTDEAALAERFAREVATFNRLGISRAHAGDAAAFARSNTGGIQLSPQMLFVNLVDFSRAEVGMQPSRAADGRFYSVLELADESLEDCLRRRRDASDFLGVAQLRDLARSLAAGLTWMHGRGLCHLDVKLANVMRFGDRWKLIDLEGAVPLCLTPPAKVDLGSVTPLYAPPELARAVLDDPEIVAAGAGVLNDLEPSGKMDIWAVGVVLLDALVHECAFQETWSSFQQAAMMSFEAEEDGLGFQKDWYTWVADPAVVRPEDYLGERPTSAALLAESPQLRELLASLLDKDPSNRLSAQEFLRHPFLSLLELGGDVAAGIRAAEAADQEEAAGAAKAGPEGPGPVQEPVPGQPPRKPAGLAQRCCFALCGRKQLPSESE